MSTSAAPNTALLCLHPSTFKPWLKIHSPIYLPLSTLIFTIIQVAVAVVHKPSFSPLGTLLKWAACDCHEGLWALNCRATAFIPFWTAYFQKSQKSEFLCEIPKISNITNPFFSKMPWTQSNRPVGIIQSISEFSSFAKEKTPLKTMSKAEADWAKNFLPTPTFGSKGPKPSKLGLRQVTPVLKKYIFCMAASYSDELRIFGNLRTISLVVLGWTGVFWLHYLSPWGQPC